MFCHGAKNHHPSDGWKLQTRIFLSYRIGSVCAHFGSWSMDILGTGPYLCFLTMGGVTFHSRKTSQSLLGKNQSIPLGVRLLQFWVTFPKKALKKDLKFPSTFGARIFVTPTPGCGHKTSRPISKKKKKKKNSHYPREGYAQG